MSNEVETLTETSVEQATEIAQVDAVEVDGVQEVTPEWAQKELAEARKEAARYRTRLRETEALLKDTTSIEGLEEAKNKLTAQVAELERSLNCERVARKHSLPDHLADRLRGNTPDELEADAAELAKLIAPQLAAPAPSTPSGGLDPTSASSSFDPEAAFRAYLQRQG